MLHEQQAPPSPAVAAPPPVPSAPSPASNHHHDDDGDGGHDVEVTTFRDIHPLTPDAPTPTPTPPARTRSWDTASHRSFSSEEQFMTMSREFTAMVAAGATMQTGGGGNGGYDGGADQLTSIGEDELEETNPLAIVPDSHPIATPARSRASAADAGLEVVPAPTPTPQPPAHVEASQVKKEEVETKVSAWQTAEVAKINNRFKREEVVINGWETEQVEEASAWLKKIEFGQGDWLY
ncbi:remorin 4.1-like isoform X2 [Miscanthus floridulus]|uniref:remorin 4.1-like isoform X2 n=1 Tax=Miscanthus floridulus TaxID=154761 RepID=UPI0034585109